MLVLQECAAGESAEGYLETFDKEGGAVPELGQLVLLVEDEPALRQLAVLMMERLGYRVAEAADGQQALALVEEEGIRPDVVLTDVLIPGMSGPELVDRLRRTVPDAQVIFMSGYTDDAVTRLGAVDSRINFLQKPFTMGALGSMLRTVLGDESVQS